MFESVTGQRGTSIYFGCDYVASLSVFEPNRRRSWTSRSIADLEKFPISIAFSVGEFGVSPRAYRNQHGQFAQS
jgi:hypothetical protein